MICLVSRRPSSSSFSSSLSSRRVMWLLLMVQLSLLLPSRRSAGEEGCNSSSGGGGPVAHALPSTVRVGGLFSPDEEEQELVFRFAIDKINADPSLLASSTLAPVIEKIVRNDSFHTDKKGRPPSFPSFLPPLHLQRLPASIDLLLLLRESVRERERKGERQSRVDDDDDG